MPTILDYGNFLGSQESPAPTLDSRKCGGFGKISKSGQFERTKGNLDLLKYMFLAGESTLESQYRK